MEYGGQENSVLHSVLLEGERCKSALSLERSLYPPMRPMSEAPEGGLAILAKIREDLTGADAWRLRGRVMVIVRGPLDWGWGLDEPFGLGWTGDDAFSGWWPLPCDAEARP